MTGKTMAIIGISAVLLGGGIYAGSQIIDWNAEHEKMAEDIQNKKMWNDSIDEVAQELQVKNSGEQVDWNAEQEKIAYELSDESALAKYSEIDWNKELEIMADDIKEKNYSGTWQQIATIMNGEQQDHAEATLILSKGAYESKTTCQVSGRLDVKGDAMTMTVGNDGCTGGMVKGSFTYSYQISNDNQILIMDYAQAGFNMREVYKRLE